MVPLGDYYRAHSSLSKAKIEIATNLTNASGNPEMAGARKLAESNRIRDYGKQIPRKAADLGLFDKESIIRLRSRYRWLERPTFPSEFLESFAKRYDSLPAIALGMVGGGP